MQEDVNWLHAAGKDFKRTRLYYMGRHWLNTQTSKIGVPQALGIGAVLGSIFMYKAPLPRVPLPSPKTRKEAAVDSFNAKRTQPSPGQMVWYDSSAPQPKLPGDRVSGALGQSSRKSGSSHSTCSSSGRAGSRGKACSQRRERGQRTLKKVAEESSDSDAEDEASMSA